MVKFVYFLIKDWIFGVVEELFVQYGFVGILLCQVISQVDVNIVVVNYYFGFKENLVNEVFCCCMDEMIGVCLLQFECVCVEYFGELCLVLVVFVELVLVLVQDCQNGGVFVCVIVCVYVEKNDNLCKFLFDYYGYVLCVFGKVIGECVLDLSKEELYWCFDFLVGLFIYVMVDFGLIKCFVGVIEVVYCVYVVYELIYFVEVGFCVVVCVSVLFVFV